MILYYHPPLSEHPNARHSTQGLSNKAMVIW
jgi:hypothetical protein